MEGNHRGSFNENVPMFVEEIGNSLVMSENDSYSLCRTEVYTVDLLLLTNFQETDKSYLRTLHELTNCYSQFI
jgi:hypothetical protein